MIVEYVEYVYMDDKTGELSVAMFDPNIGELTLDRGNGFEPFVRYVDIPRGAVLGEIHFTDSILINLGEL